MPEQRTYPHGVTCWIDLEQPDLDATCRFYTGLFGWTLTEATPLAGGGSYRIATLDGGSVAGLGSAPAGAAGWNTYVAVDDADATAAAVTDGGGSVVRAPTDAGTSGRSAVCADPAGAAFRLWQPRDLPGAQVTNAPGTWNFSDLYADDVDAAMAFYAPLFGWVTADLGQDAGAMIRVPGYGDHLAATVDPTIHERQEMAPPGFADVIGGLALLGAGEPTRWHVTFTVADRDDSVARAESLGATVLRSAEDLWTRNAVLRDPQGAELSVSQFTPPEGW